MQLVLIRHGAHDGEELTLRGLHQSRRAAAALRRCGVEPTLYLSSNKEHVTATRDVIAGELGGSARRDTCAALTRGADRPERLECLLDELVRKNIRLSADDCVVLVGQEGRLSNLLTELISQRSRPFEHGDIAHVVADDLIAVCRGHGTLDFRYPVVDHSEEALRKKAETKMTVASFLAGFVFAALIEVLLNHPDARAHRIAAVLLTLSLALFVAAVYVFDQLSMPSGFWTDAPRTTLVPHLAAWRERRAEERWLKAWSRRPGGAVAADDTFAGSTLDGSVYWTMVRTSLWLFTPAVLCALAGFGAIVAHSPSWWVRGGALASLAVGVVWYWARRPTLGVD